MTLEFASRFSRGALIGTLAVSFTVLCAGQPVSPAPSNPRAPADDPRIGLKGGLHDAAEVAWGMERVVSLPKPPGFDEVTTTPAQPPREGSNQPGRGPSVSYGSTNSDL